MAYPPDASGDQVVVLELVIDADGSVTSVAVIQGEAPFRAAALEAARQWRFAPARRAGKPPPLAFAFGSTSWSLGWQLQTLLHSQQPGASPAAGQPQPTEASAQAPATTSPGPPPAPVEIQVQGQRSTGARQVSRAEARQLPGAFGETFRAIEMFPGVTPTLSGAPYFYVRGAPPANLGYFLDDIRLPALFHVFAGPSVVHPALVDSMDFYAGPYPARYGRFTGGIAAGQLREPTGELHGEVNVRAFDSSALVEVPLTDGTSLTLGGRYSYADPVAHLFAPEISVLYWDYQARVSTQLTRDDRFVVFVFGSRDKLDETNDEGEVKPVFGAEFHRLDLAYHRTFPGGSARVRSLLGFDKSLQQDGDGRAHQLAQRLACRRQETLRSVRRIERRARCQRRAPSFGARTAG